MAKSLMDMIIDKIFTPDVVGSIGERRIDHELDMLQLFGHKGKSLRNIYIPKNDGSTSEIDLVFITRQGIFVIESKNYSGWIFGNEKYNYWTASLSKNMKNKFYNPIKQNRTHIKWLKKYLGKEIQTYSIIVFSERCELKDITVESTDVKVIQRDSVYATIRDIMDDAPDRLTDDEVNDIFEQLNELTDVDKAVKEAHIRHINEKHIAPKDSSSKTKTDDPVKTSLSDPEQKEDLVCPRCGSPLVLRQAKKGKYSGNSFYGCSGFPKCRYIKNIGDNTD